MATTTKKPIRRHTGEIILRGQIWYYRHYDAQGRRRLQSSHSTDRADAERLLRQRLSAKDAGVHGEAAAGRLTVAEGLADMIADYRVNHRRSLKNIEGKINLHLVPYFGERRKMSTITTAMLRGFVVERQASGASNAEINRELSILRRAFSLAVAGGRLVQRPHFPMLRENNTRTGFFEAHQYQAVLGHLPAEVQPVITFAYITGWRIASEVLPLQWRQVDFAAGEVRLDAGTTKNGDGRVFPMTAELRRLLQTLHADYVDRKKAGQLTPQVFVRMVAKGRGGDKRPVPIIAFTKAWKAACRAAGCPGRIPHDLRRTAVRGLVRAGIPERVAMQMTGHKTRSVFERYNIVSEGDLRDAAQRLDVMAATLMAARS